MNNSNNKSWIYQDDSSVDCQQNNKGSGLRRRRLGVELLCELWQSNWNSNIWNRNNEQSVLRKNMWIFIYIEYLKKSDEDKCISSNYQNIKEWLRLFREIFIGSWSNLSHFKVIIEILSNLDLSILTHIKITWIWERRN